MDEEAGEEPHGFVVVADTTIDDLVGWTAGKEISRPRAARAPSDGLVTSMSK
jgi:hypothetical protein